MSCPKCESSLAYVITQMSSKECELYDLDSSELIRVSESSEAPKPIKTYRVAECAKCGHNFRLSNDEFENVRWC